MFSSSPASPVTRDRHPRYGRSPRAARTSRGQAPSPRHRVPDEWKALPVLNLSSQGLTRVPDLSGLTALEKLDLSHNSISVLDGVAEVPNLSSLTLAHNAVRAVDGLPRRLVSLDLSHNHLDSIASLRALADCPRLVSVSLAGNPVANDAELRAFLLENLPALERLDGELIPVEEKTDATRRRLAALRRHHVPAPVYDEDATSPMYDTYDTFTPAEPDLHDSASLRARVVDQEATIRQLQAACRRAAAGRPHYPSHAVPDTSHLEREVQLLHAQVEALNGVVEIQEQNIKSLVQPGDADSRDPAQVIELWRNKVFQLLVQAQSAELAAQDERAALEERIAEMERRLEAADLEKRALLQRQAAHASEIQAKTERCQHLSRVNASLEARLRTHEKAQQQQSLEHGRLAAVLADVDRAHARQCAQLQAAVHGKLQQLSDRVGFAKSRVAAVSSVRRASHRNVSAAGMDLAREQAMQAASDHLQREIQRVTAERDRLLHAQRSQSTAARQQLEEAQRDVRGLESKVAALQQALQAERDDHAALRVRQDAAMQRAESRAAEACDRAFREGQEEGRADLEAALAAERAQAAADWEELSRRYEEAQHELSISQRAVESLRRQLRRERQVGAVQDHARVQHLQRTVERQAAELDRLQAALERPTRPPRRKHRHPAPVARSPPRERSAYVAKLSHLSRLSDDLLAEYDVLDEEEEEWQ